MLATLIRNYVPAEVINTTRETDQEKHTDTQCIHVWSDNGNTYILYKYNIIHNIYNPPSCKLNVEQDLPTHINITYMILSGHSPMWGYSDHTATGHTIEDVLIASNLIMAMQRLPHGHRIIDPIVRRAHGPKPSTRKQCEQNTVHHA